MTDTSDVAAEAAAHQSAGGNAPEKAATGTDESGPTTAGADESGSPVDAPEAEATPAPSAGVDGETAVAQVGQAPDVEERPAPEPVPLTKPDPAAGPAPTGPLSTGPLPTGPIPTDPGRPTAPPNRLRGVALAAAVSALVAVVCALALPFAPVSVNEPTVSWPRDPARPTSTLLQLAAYHPLTMDIAFSCDVARLAQSVDGVVISTTSPDNPIAGTIGLIAVSRGNRLEIRALDRVVLDEPLPSGKCEYRISGVSKGLPSFVRPEDPAHPILPPMSQFAQPDNAHLTISRDGLRLVDADAEQLPDVDMIATSVPQLPSSMAGQFSVHLRTDDEFTSSPTPFKSVLIWLLVIALVVTLALLAVMDRTVARVPTRWVPGWPRLVDLVVPAVIVYWMFLAPATDDDGYYAQMAHNSVITGRVGNYYQLYDQNFTPFTWFYQALGWWQQIAGVSPFAQRVPAAVFGILTWILLRRFVIMAMREWAPERRWTRVLMHAVLAVVFLSWWTALDMGVRPETIVGACATAALVAVLAAHRRKRLVFAFLAVAVAGAGFVAHPTGFTLFAPLLAGLPLLWPVLRVPGSWFLTALRVVAVASAGMLAPLMAFADGTLRDFLRGQTIFLSIQAQDDWTGEYQRYAFLLSQIPMGNYAKRAAVLACVVGLVWFVALATAARLRDVAVPTPLWLSATTTGLAFGLLWLTPSKWSHHFGALAGVGSAFLALLLVTSVPLLREVLARDDGERVRIPAGIVAAAVVSVLTVITLAWHGPNLWPYADLDGVRRSGLPPAVFRISLDTPTVWVVAFVLVAAVVVLVTRLRKGGRDLRLAMLRAVPIVLVCSLAMSAGYTLTTFGIAAATHTPRDAVWSDPTGANCTAAGAISVYDPDTAVTLLPAFGLAQPAAPEGFVEGSGYYLGNQPQGSGAGQIWGSLISQDGRNPELTNGRMSTEWFTLDPARGGATTVLAAGTLSQGNSLTAVYGRRFGSAVVPAGTQEIEDPTRDPSWRTFTLTPPPGADVVRLDAVDATGATHGWLAFSAPSVEQPVLLSTYLPRDAPVALSWQLAFAYPCQRQSTVRNGIVESPRYAIAYGDPEKTLSGFGDGVFQTFRGGVYAPSLRSVSVQQLAVVPGEDPHVEVFTFGSELARADYTVTTAQRVTAGADAADHVAFG